MFATEERFKDVKQINVKLLTLVRLKTSNQKISLISVFRFKTQFGSDFNEL